ncbi:MAG: late competence development ComFB family protein [Spirochaetes bacterium]|nr:late competence development ComFB family protein [Spirochaetota bacterium]
MGIVNIMEDKIKSTVIDVLATRDDRFLLTSYIEDIIAYVLNRVPPRYITSERGFVHSEIEFSIDIQLQADIKFCVDDAIRTLIHRREPEARNAETDYLNEISVSKHYFFPHIAGEVLEDSTFKIIPNVEIQLVYNDSRVPMIDPAWSNPYFTCNSTKGFYMFWPDFMPDDMNNSGDNLFRIIYHHKNYHRKEVSFSLRVMDKFTYASEKVIPLTFLKPRD